MPANNTELEKRLWDAADELRANSKLKSSEYSMPVLGLVFLKWADFKFAYAQEELEKETKEGSTRRRREIGKVDYQAKGVIFVPEKARFSYLVTLPESADIGKAINQATELVEAENEDLRGVLPKAYQSFESPVLLSLLRIFNSIPMDVEGDVFGKIYEYFLGKFAMAEGQKGGEFFTPISIVRLIVEILEPFHGRVYDPACGSGGMFVQSARFVREHRRNPSEELSIYGQERVSETVKLCRMNLAVHSLAGDIKEGNTYYEDIHESIRKFDFVMANPPFNVDRVDKERLKDDPRFGLGIPRADNANFLWIQAFLSALGDSGRAGFVMANSASTARDSEMEIRRRIIESKVVDVMILTGPRFFYTVPLACTLWFLDKTKKGEEREDKVLFIDARRIFTQLDRAHRQWSSYQIDFIANIVRLYRSEKAALVAQVSSSQDPNEGLESMWKTCFPDGTYRDVRGLCCVTSIDDIRKRKWSLNPGVYVGVEIDEDEGLDFMVELETLSKQLRDLQKEAHKLESDVSSRLGSILETDE